MSEQDNTSNPQVADASSGDGSDAEASGAGDHRTRTSTAKDRTGVDPQDPIDPDSPNLQAGG